MKLEKEKISSEMKIDGINKEKSRDRKIYTNNK